MTNDLISKSALIDAIKEQQEYAVKLMRDNGHSSAAEFTESHQKDILRLINSAPVVNGEATGNIRIIGYVSESDLTFPFAYPSLSYQSETRNIPVYVDALIEHDESEG